MKKLLTKNLLLILLLFPVIGFGQAPEAFKYQAVIRDGGNLILTDQAVGMRLSIQQGSIGGTSVYTETFTSTSNGYGLVNLEIGTGISTDDFAIIDWVNGPYFMETAVDLTGGITYEVMGTSQLMSVPYALYAKTSGNGEGPQGPAGVQGSQGIQGIAGIDGQNGVDGINGADGSAGPQGLQGPAGETGINGNDGVDGITGGVGTGYCRDCVQEISMLLTDVNLTDCVDHCLTLNENGETDWRAPTMDEYIYYSYVQP